MAETPELPNSSGKLMNVTNKGLHTDTNQEFQPDGTYRFALNASLETEIGEQGAISNYKGNLECVDLAAHGITIDYVLVGAGNINDEQVILIFTNEVDTVIARQFNCELTVLIKTSCMNLKKTNHVDILYKLQNGCDHIINFTDNYNRYHNINLSNLERYLVEGRTLLDANDNSTGSYGWDCSQFYLSPDYNYPDVELIAVNSSGQLPVGAYKFSIRYLDNRYNETSFMTVTQPVYITLSDPDTNIDFMTGGVYGLADNNGFIRSNKAINLLLKNIDKRYSYLQIAVLLSANQSDVITDIRLSEVIPINDNELIYTLTDVSNLVSTSLNDITIQDFKINVVRTHTNHQNRLLIGNISNPNYDWASFQKIANDIKVYFTEVVGQKNLVDGCTYNFSNVATNDISSKEQSYSSPKLSYDTKGYMRDEIYSFGIVFVFKNGFESPVFHIPGRPKIGVSTGGTDVVDTYPLFDGGSITAANCRASWAASEFLYNSNNDLNWDDIEYSIGSQQSIYTFTDTSTSVDYERVIIPQSENIHSNNVYFNCNESSIPRWKHVNTAVDLGSSTDIAAEDINSSYRKRKYIYRNKYLPGYFETDTKYPNTLDCDGLPIFPHNVIDDGLGNISYEMHNVRHHRVPDAKISPIYIPRDGDTNRCDLVIMLPFFYNINIPQDFKDQIQGYYIVRSDRAGNKTVVDKGWMNITDSTNAWGSGQIVAPKDEFKTIEANSFFMSLHRKNGMDGTAHGDKRVDLMNIVEFASPKLLINDRVNLPISYFKLENTMHGDRIIIHRKEDVSGNTKVGLSAFNLYIKKAKIGVLNPGLSGSYAAFRYSSDYLTRPEGAPYAEWFGLAENIPIASKEYAIYDQNNVSIIESGFLTFNAHLRQTIGLAKIFNIDRRKYDLLTNNNPRFGPPRAYSTVDEVSSLVFNLTSGIGSVDALWFNQSNIWEMLEAAESEPSPRSNDWLPGDDVDGYKTRFNHSSYVYYVGLKANIIPYRRLENIRYLNTTNYIINPNETSVVIGGGDTFLTNFSLFKSYISKGALVGTSRDKYIGSLLYGIVESEVNMDYRHKERGDDYYAHPFDSIKQVVDTQLGQFISDTRDRLEQLYKYNLDYSDDTNEKTFVALSDIYDYCASCREKFPRTVYYSEVSLPDQINDINRRFFVNSTIDLLDDVTNLFVKEDNLFIHTIGNLFRVNTGAQEMQTNNDTIQLGAADLSSARLQKMFDNVLNLNRGGCNFRFSGSFCLDQYIWVDDDSKRVYALQQQVKEISAIGMRKWFTKNLTLTLDEQYKNTYYRIFGKKKSYPYRGTTSNTSIGFISIFDPEHRLYLLTKKDYKISEELLNNVLELPSNNYIPGQLYISDLGFHMGITESEAVIVGDVLPGVLEYNGFTIGYSIDSEAWVSYYSFLPNMYYRTDDAYYSYITSFNKLFKHNQDNYQTYYFKKFDHIVELIFKESPYTDITFDNFEYVNNVFLKDNNNNYDYEFDNVTFNKFYVYNNNQISNLINIIPGDRNPYSRINYSIGASNAYRNRNIWRISRFRDLAINRPTTSMFSSDFNLLDYNSYFDVGRGWIDKVINPSFIDLSKKVYSQARFTDKYLGVRLFFNNLTDYKIVTNLFTSLKRTRI